LVWASEIWRLYSARRIECVAARRPAPRSRFCESEKFRSDVYAGFRSENELSVSKREIGRLMLSSPPVRSGTRMPGVIERDVDCELSSAEATASSLSRTLALSVKTDSKRASSSETCSAAMVGEIRVALRLRLLAIAAMRALSSESSTRSRLRSGPARSGAILQRWVFPPACTRAARGSAR
jgi:hypothetical protein